jgi:hypothetical protein
VNWTKEQKEKISVSSKIAQNDPKKQNKKYQMHCHLFGK